MNLGLVRWDTCWLPTGQPPYPGHLAPTSFLCLILCLLSFCLFLSSGNPTAAAETGGFYQGDFWSSGNDRMERQKDRGRSLKPLPNASGGRGASQMRLLQKLWFWEKKMFAWECLWPSCDAAWIACWLPQLIQLDGTRAEYLQLSPSLLHQSSLDAMQAMQGEALGSSVWRIKLQNFLRSCDDVGGRYHTPQVHIGSLSILSREEETARPHIGVINRTKSLLTQSSTWHLKNSNSCGRVPVQVQKWS